MIRDILTERGWTAYRLAKESGLSRQVADNLSKRVELDKVPYGTLRKAANALGYDTVDELVKESRQYDEKE